MVQSSTSLGDSGPRLIIQNPQSRPPRTPPILGISELPAAYLCQFRSGVKAARYSGKARRASAPDGCYPLPSAQLRAILFRSRRFFEGRADCNQLRIRVRIARILRLPEGGLTSS